MKRGFLFLVVSFFILGMMPEMAKSETASSAKKKLPELMTWTSYDVGSSGYVQAAAVGDALTKKTGLKLRVLPAGTDIARLTPIKLGSADFALSGLGCYFAWRGTYEFASYEWGPQPLRTVYHAIPHGIGLATAADANIKTPKDLKGKRVPWVPGAPALNVGHEAFLAFAGLTWKDVQKVVFPSYGAAAKAIIENNNDCLISTATAAYLFELQSTKRGVYWPEFPASDKEGWARLNKVSAPFFPDIVNEGAGFTKDKPREVPTYAYPTLTAYENKDEDFVYGVAKAIHESFDLFKDVNLAMKGWEIKKAIRPPGNVPFHKGAIKYFKEAGVWTPELEKWNNNALDQEKKTMDSFAKMKKEAMEKKVSTEEFGKMWMKSLGIETQ